MNIKPFDFKYFTLQQSPLVMKVSTDSILLGSWAKVKNAKNILDIGTGTGILALLLASKSNADIEALDINEAAIKIAELNFKNSSWANRMFVCNSSLQKFNPQKKYDIIISNPPYFKEITLSPKHEKNMARNQIELSHKDLVHYTALLLHKKGSAYFCFPYSNDESIIIEAKRSALFINRKMYVRSTQNKTPYLVLCELSYRETETLIEQLTIYTGNKKYTEEFIELTKESYGIRI